MRGQESPHGQDEWPVVAFWLLVDKTHPDPLCEVAVGAVNGPEGGSRWSLVG